MAWNEPGGNKNDNDPWGGKGDQGPPDLDEAFRKFKKKFSGNGGNGSGGMPGGDLPEFNTNYIFAALGLGLLLWFGMGWYQVDEQENAVVLRFGEYLESTGPGLHWNPPVVDSVQKVNVTRLRSSTHRGLMLTKDDNIVEISLSVQYTVSDPKAFTLEIRAPERSLGHAAESALRHVIGSAELHQVLTEGRAAIAIEIQERLQNYLNMYHTGIQITTVNIEDAQPPAEVQAAFDDVIRAKEDEARLQNEAETYEKGIIPVARGMAQRQMEESNAYKEQVIARAEGEAQRFTQLLKEYEKAPEVTRKRLYIDTMQKIMANSSKVMVDVDSGNLLYLPLDKLMNTPSSQLIDETFKSSYSDVKNTADRIQREYNRSSTRREGR